MTVIQPAPLQLFIGDDWTVLIPLVDGSNNPVNLTTAGLTPGAEFFQATSTAAIALTVANNGITIVDATNGKFTVNIGQVLTGAAIPLATTAVSPRTRIHVFVTDVSSRRTTVGIIPIIPLAP